MDTPYSKPMIETCSAPHPKKLNVERKDNCQSRGNVGQGTEKVTSTLTPQRRVIMAHLPYQPVLPVSTDDQSRITHPVRLTELLCV